ncbi:MAG TPA: methyltransferase domain-containing protein [Xanthomonadaceae bacterium]|nr:methyltransferase domain-containing protein [Xanthomonadaceae bacterium]
MTTSTQWQLALDAAARYEEVLVPSILGPAALALVDRAGLREGESVLDVGCGTGAATRFAAERTGPSGRVVGVDVNEGMIDVARSMPPVAGPTIEWVAKSAYELPFAAEQFDVVLCAQTLQFLQDRPRALAEMRRVLKPGGRVAVSLWSDIRESPYFHALVQAVSRHIGAETAAGLEAAFSLSDGNASGAMISAAGFEAVNVSVAQLELRLPAPAMFVPRHVSATPMSAGFDAASATARQLVIDDTARELAQYATSCGMTVPFRTQLVLASR